ncbi:MAG: pyridoxal-phosphate dependent enzyme [Spirochaetia bacterium]|nr:pyridoxal-phosphate dependent enzyme [Spirochaetia bacterium]
MKTKIMTVMSVLMLSFMMLTGCCSTQPSTCQSSQNEVTIDKIFNAVQVLDGVAKCSDLVEAPSFSGENQVYLKLETQQIIGAFKIRGAYYKMSQLTPEQAQKGVVTCSSGNHAQGVAYSAEKFNIPAKIFMPASAPAKKVNAVRSYRNAEAILVDGDFNASQEAALAYQKEHDAVYVAPYNDLDVIAGQGTIGWEIMHQLPDADVVVVPMGGGGLISGIASAIKALNPSCRIIGVQSDASDAMVRSRAAGKIVKRDNISTLADGTAVSVPGDITFEICQKYVDEMVTVTEDQIADAIRRLYNECNVTAEGAGALSAAAVLNGKIAGNGQKIVCVISGGNIDPDKLNGILGRK